MRALSALTAASLALSAFAATADDWKSRSIYQVSSAGASSWLQLLTALPFSKIVTDRFSLGNSTYPPCNTTEKAYCGGNWQGIVNNLDYIQNMGFDAVWISPIVKQVDTTPEGDPYHG